MRLVTVTDTDLLRVTDTLLLRVTDTDLVRVTDTVVVRVKGLEEAIGDCVTVLLVVIDDKLDGFTVTAGERLLVTDNVLDKDTVIELLLVSETEFVLETVTVPVRVKGLEEAIGDCVTVLLVDIDDKLDGFTVTAGERLLVTDNVLDKDTVIELLLVSETEFVREIETVDVRVKGLVDGIGDLVTVTVVDIEGRLDGWTVTAGERLPVIDSDFVLVTVTVVVRVKGLEVGIGDRVTVMVVDDDGKLDGWTVTAGERLPVIDSDFVLVTVTVVVRVKGTVVGIGDRVTVTVVDVDGKLDARTVTAGELLPVIDSDFVLVTVTVTLKLKRFEDGNALRVIVIDVDLVAILVDGMADFVTVIEFVLVNDTVGLTVKPFDDGIALLDTVIDVLLVIVTDDVPDIECRLLDGTGVTVILMEGDLVLAWLCVTLTELDCVGVIVDDLTPEGLAKFVVGSGVLVVVSCGVAE